MNRNEGDNIHNDLDIPASFVRLPREARYQIYEGLLWIPQAVHFDSYSQLTTRWHRKQSPLAALLLSNKVLS